MTINDWLDAVSLNSAVDLYNGDHRTCFIGPEGADWVYRIDRADSTPGGFATHAATMQDGYAMSHPRVPKNSLGVGPVCATRRKNGTVTFTVIGGDGRSTATGAALIFLGSGT